MSLGKRLIQTGVAACLTETTDIFGGSTGKALYSMDYDASDTSGVYNGTPTNVDFGVSGQINTAARFNGSSSLIAIGSPIPNTDTNVAISAWVKLNSGISGHMHITGTGITTAGSEAPFRATLQYQSANTFRLFALRQVAGTYYLADNSTLTNVTMNADVWYHVVWSYNATGRQLSTFLNGTPIDANKAMSTSGSSVNDSTTVIGSFRSTSGPFFDGTIDQLRIFHSTIDSSQASTLAAETACVHTSTTDIVNYPNSKTNKAYIKFDNSAEDLVSGDHGTIADGMDFKFGRYGQAIRTTANAHGVDFPNISMSANASFSYSCWVNLTDITQRFYFFFWSTGSGATSAWGGILNGGGGKPYFNFANNAATASSITVPQDQWFHYVATFDGTTAKAYVDKQLALTATISTNGLGTNNLRILDTVADTEGMIDQVRVYDLVLDTDDIDKLYNEKAETDTSNFKAVLYEGNNTTGHFINNVGIDLETNGGLVWIKSRNDAAGDNHILQDNVRGVSNFLMSSSTSAESASDMVTSFEKTGFFLGADTPTGVNTNNIDFVSWVWKGGGTPATIGVNSITGSTPSIASSVSANAAAGFSIVKYTGNSTDNATVGHGLGVAPSLVIVKDLDATNEWCIGGSAVGDGKNLYFTSAAVLTRDRVKSVQTNTFTLGNHFETNSTNDFIAYCFANVTGYQKIGTYEGTNSTVTVSDVGFKPTFVMIKNVDDTGDWVMLDNRRNTITDRLNNWLRANTTGVETGAVSSAYITVNDNGFIVGDTTSLGTNSNGDTYIYMAIK